MSLRGGLAGAVSCFLTAMPIAAAPRSIEVDSRLVDCIAVGPTKCLRVRDRDGEPWHLFYGQIEGFTFEPGYRYLLQVDEIPVPNPPADSSAIRTVLVEMVRKLAVEPPADPFAGKVWRLHHMEAGEGAAPFQPQAMMTLAVDTPAGRASGKGGCNRWFGSAVVEGPKLTLAGMGATMMSCPPKDMEEERAFLTALSRTAGYMVDEHGLTLTLQGGGQLRFRELLD